MKRWTRREFGAAVGAAGLALAPRMALGQAKPRVVVVGGGVGGSTVSKYLATGSKALDITLIEPKARYATCFFSNLYLAGLSVVEIARPTVTRRSHNATALTSSISPP